MRALASIALAALALGAASSAAHAQEEAEPLRALVWEYEDPHTSATGAVTALERAGFAVDAFQPADKIPWKQADLVVLGSFVSEHMGYGAFAANRTKELAAFLKRGGVALVFTQADQTEGTSKVLPKGLVAMRCDDDAADLYVMAEGHALLEGMARHAKEPDRLALERYAGRRASWESFAWQEGFRVLLASGTKRDRFALLEAPAGKGRLLLTSLHFDKEVRTERKGGTTPIGVKERPHADRFFANLATYVRSVRDGTAPDVTPTPPPPEETDPPLAGPATPAWRLAPSDTAQYERAKVRSKGRARFRGASAAFGVHGHHLSADRQYRPAAAVRADLPALLAFGLPAAGESKTKLDVLLEDVGKLVPIRVRGDVRAERIEGRAEALVTGSYTFASKGRGAKDDENRIEKGTATAHGVFDLAEGVFLRTEVEVAYQLVKIDAKRSDKPTNVRQHLRWDLVALRRHRYATFQDDVDAAIDRGVAWLHEERDAEGRWKPHGEHDIGTQALVLHTLVACDTPHDDPVVESTLAWLFTQDPRTNYERSVALMAVDDCYAPEGEVENAKRSAGAGRALPDDRRAWVERVARELEKAASQPGSWGYPNKGNELMRFDTSNTQYAVLGMRAARRLGVEVREKTWLGVLRHFEIVQQKDGPKGAIALVYDGEAIRDEGRTTDDAAPVKKVAGFRYSPLQNHLHPWASMTCAGIASMAIARHELELLGSSKMTARNRAAVEEMMLGGWAWLDAHWALDRHPRKPGGNWYYYFLYSLERAGILHRVKRVGGKDWYFEGACELIARQKSGGGWGEGKEAKIAETCFALLFLKRATAPLTGR